MGAIAVDLNRIMISETAGSQVIVLRERGGKRMLPIWIGLPEALAIHRRVQGETPPRPLTHDLLRDAISAMGGRLDRVLIDRFEPTDTGGTFHAKLVLNQEGKTIRVDARPSDAVALAIRCDAPLFVEEEILKEEGKEPAAPSEESGDSLEEEEEEGEEDKEEQP